MRMSPVRPQRMFSQRPFERLGRSWPSPADPSSEAFFHTIHHIPIWLCLLPPQVKCVIQTSEGVIESWLDCVCLTHTVRVKAQISCRLFDLLGFITLDTLLFEPSQSGEITPLLLSPSHSQYLHHSSGRAMPSARRETMMISSV